jgi:hypothetical protein
VRAASRTASALGVMVRRAVGAQRGRANRAKVCADCARATPSLHAASASPLHPADLLPILAAARSRTAPVAMRPLRSCKHSEHTFRAYCGLASAAAWQLHPRCAPAAPPSHVLSPCARLQASCSPAPPQPKSGCCLVSTHLQYPRMLRHAGHGLLRLSRYACGPARDAGLHPRWRPGPSTISKRTASWQARRRHCLAWRLPCLN